MNFFSALNTFPFDIGGIVVIVVILLLLGPIIVLVFVLLMARWILGMNEIIRLLEKIADKTEKQ